MKKNTGKKDNTKGKKAEVKPKRVTVKKELNPARVHKDISALVEAQANELTEAVIGEGLKGQVSPVKYLFEMARIWPQVEGTVPTENEDSLAKTLLTRLKIPLEPVVHDELQKEEDEDVDVVTIKPVAEKREAEESEDEEKKEEVVTVH